MVKKNTNEWLFIISSKRKLIDFNFKEVWRYKDLLFLFVKRDLVTVYKQTILGPLWYFIEPLFTTLIFTLIFNNVANISTGGVPSFLFNLAGVTIWNYFKVCFTSTSNTFSANAGIFGKVYFPRIIVPLSVVVSNLLRFGIQLLVFICFYIYYFNQGAEISLNKHTVVFPFVIIIMGMLGLGLGMIISSLVTKYRDLKILIGFGLQLLMYVSAVMYPVSYFEQKLPDYAWLIKYNPLTSVIESVRYMLLSTGEFNLYMFLYTIAVTFVIFFVGIIIFNKTEKNFIDTV